MISASPLAGVPEIQAGTDLGELIAKLTAAGPQAEQLAPGDILVIAHKIVSKTEGRVRRLGGVTPSERAVELARLGDRDPRVMEVVLQETRVIVRAAPGVIVCETHHGFICANAGVDRSNVPGEDAILMLPLDPDRSARTIRARLRELTGVAPGIVISDSFGRAWRNGQTDIAIGLAGVRGLDDWRGRPDAQGRRMRATVIAVADLLAGTADLARAKDASQPVVLIRGAAQHVTSQDGPGVAPLLRARSHDLFR
ncbi:MAG: coenzyme F420-0:L-glutamate ligase [Solirubrobacteraceae bacterium]